MKTRLEKSEEAVGIKSKYNMWLSKHNPCIDECKAQMLTGEWMKEDPSHACDRIIKLNCSSGVLPPTLTSSLFIHPVSFRLYFRSYNVETLWIVGNSPRQCRPITGLALTWPVKEVDHIPII